jgi:hypothetical protein
MQHTSKESPPRILIPVGGCEEAHLHVVLDPTGHDNVACSNARQDCHSERPSLDDLDESIGTVVNLQPAENWPSETRLQRL